MDFEVLFRQYYPRLRNYASRFVESTEAAEDIVQECFVKLYQKRFSVKDVSMQALLYVMVRNSCLNYVKHRMLLQTGTAFHLSTELTPEDDIMFDELRIEIERVMRGLPSKCREVLHEPFRGSEYPRDRGTH